MSGGAVVRPALSSDATHSHRCHVSSHTPAGAVWVPQRRHCQARRLNPPVAAAAAAAAAATQSPLLSVNIVGSVCDILVASFTDHHLRRHHKVTSDPQLGNESARHTPHQYGT